MTAPTIISQDMNEAGYLLYLTSEGLDSTTATNLVNHLIAIAPADNMIPTEIVEQNAGAVTPVPDILTPEGDQPMVLALHSSGNTVDTSLFPHLHTIIQPYSGQGNNVLTILGPNNEHIYLGDLGGVANNNFDIILNDTGNDYVYGGDANGDTVICGAGADHVILGTGVTPSGPTGVHDYIQGGTGSNQVLNGLDPSTLFQDGTGGNQTLIGKGGGDTFSIGNASSELVRLGGSDNNTINVAFDGANQATIDGFTKTDIINFADTFADATITTTNLECGAPHSRFNAESIFTPRGTGLINKTPIPSVA